MRTGSEQPPMGMEMEEGTTMGTSRLVTWMLLLSVMVQILTPSSCFTVWQKQNTGISPPAAPIRNFPLDSPNGINKEEGQKMKPTLDMFMFTFEANAEFVLVVTGTQLEYVPAVTTIVLSLLNEIYFGFFMKVNVGALFPDCSEAAQISFKTPCVANITIVLIWTVHACFGTGKLGNYTVKQVLAEIVLVMGTSILRLITAELGEPITPTTRILVDRATLLRLSNEGGRSMYRSDPVRIGTLHFIWNTAQRLLKLYWMVEGRLSMLVRLMMPLTCAWTPCSGRRRDRSSQLVLYLFSRTPMKRYLLGYWPLVQMERGQASPLTVMVQTVPALIILGLLDKMSWQGVVGSATQEMTAVPIMQQGDSSNRLSRQQEGRLTIQIMLELTCRLALTMVNTMSWLNPSVLKYDFRAILLVTYVLNTGNDTRAVLSRVWVLSFRLLKIMLKAPLVWLAGVQIPLIVMVQVSEISCAGSVKEKVMRQLLEFRVQSMGSTVPFELLMMILRRNISALTPDRSCPMTKTRSSSAYRFLGRQKTRVRVEQLKGVKQEYPICSMEMG